jgi:endonuclease-8
MPEGDTVARAAARLRPVLVGRTLTVADGAPPVRRWASRLVGHTVVGVRTHGKHLFIDVEGGVTIHVHLGMPGRWRVFDRPGRLGDRGAVRLLLGTAAHTAVCYAAPTVEVDRRQVMDRVLARLGPDVLDTEIDLASVSERAALLPPGTIVADLLLDQRVVAGVGNKYKSEVLFLEGLHPETPATLLGADRIEALARRARRIMRPRRPRDTTGAGDGWVYDRAGRPCRRCRTAIQQAMIGARPRVTFWCPRCQPPPASPR